VATTWWPGSNPGLIFRAQHQPGADQQHHGGGHLAGHQQVPQPVAVPIAGGAAAVQYPDDIGAGHLQRRQETQQERGDDRQQGGEPERGGTQVGAELHRDVHGRLSHVGQGDHQQGEEVADPAGEECVDQALDQHLPHQGTPAGAQGPAHPQLAAPRWRR